MQKNMETITDYHVGATYVHAIQIEGLLRTPGLNAVIGTTGDVMRQWSRNNGLGLATVQK